MKNRLNNIHVALVSKFILTVMRPLGQADRGISTLNYRLIIDLAQIAYPGVKQFLNTREITNERHCQNFSQSTL
jgi:hypothetical protein